MAQFEIKRIIPLELFGIDASFTNASLLMVMAVVLISGFMIFAIGPRQLVPRRIQSIAELSYEYIAGMVRENLGEEGMKFFPWVFTIFIFILMLNFIGLIPGKLHRDEPHHRDLRARRAWCGSSVTLDWFRLHGCGYLKLFVPSGVPILADARHHADRDHLLSRSVRSATRCVLFANMMAGPHDAEGVRRLCRDAALVGQGRAVGLHGGVHRA